MPKRYDDATLDAVVSTKNFDADEAIFLAEELDSVKAQIYKKRYPAYNAKNVMPVSTDAGAGAETISFRMFDAVAMAKIVSNYATDFPNVALTGTKTSVPVVSLGDMYGYSIQDLRAAQMAKIPLSTDLAAAARQGMEAKANKLAWQGDENHGLFGMLNHPNISQFTLPADGNGSATTFASKTDDQVLRDLDDFVGAQVDLTIGVETPDTLLVPPRVLRQLTGRYLNGTAVTLYKAWLDNNGYVKDILSVPELQGAGLNGADVMIAYRKDPDKFTLEIPVPFEQFPPQYQGMELQVFCHERFGGLLVRFPLSIIKAEGV